MKQHLKILFIVCCLLISIALSGCSVTSIDVENLLRPPMNNSEQEQLKTALEQYICTMNSTGELESYTLKYPTEGRYLSAFILIENSNPQTALAFYQLNRGNDRMHIHLLRKEVNSWISVSDIEGFSEEVAQAEFADLDGDGTKELLIGWNLYNSLNKRLCVYRTDGALTLLDTETITYSSLLTGRFSSSGDDDILLANASFSDENAEVRLLSYEGRKLIVKGSAVLDAGIRRFGNTVRQSLSETIDAVFWDCYKDPGTTVTELIYWDGQQLKTPFCGNDFHLASDTARAIDITSRDIDGDGIVEWPVCTRISAESTEEDTPVWRADWMTYDFDTGKQLLKFRSFINIPDNYFIKIPEIWSDKVTASYDKDTRIMTVINPEKPEEASSLRIQTTTTGKKTGLADSTFTYFDNTAYLRYAVSCPEMTLEQVNYLFGTL